MIDKEYIGDGVYIQEGHSLEEIKLTTEDGISVSNVIYLELYMIQHIIEYIQRQATGGLDER